MDSLPKLEEELAPQAEANEAATENSPLVSISLEAPVHSAPDPVLDPSTMEMMKALGAAINETQEAPSVAASVVAPEVPAEVAPEIPSAEPVVENVVSFSMDSILPTEASSSNYVEAPTEVPPSEVPTENSAANVPSEAIPETPIETPVSSFSMDSILPTQSEEPPMGSSSMEVSPTEASALPTEVTASEIVVPPDTVPSAEVSEPALEMAPVEAVQESISSASSFSTDAALESHVPQPEVPPADVIPAGPLSAALLAQATTESAAPVSVVDDRVAFSVRILASLCDHLAVVGITLGSVVALTTLAIWFGGEVIIRDVPGSHALLLLAAVSTVVWFLNVILYFGIFAKKRSSSPGKILYGLKIVEEGSDEEVFHSGKALAREFAKVFDLFFFFGLVLMARRKDGRGFHDFALNTRVVKSK